MLVLPERHATKTLQHSAASGTTLAQLLGSKLLNRDEYVGQAARAFTTAGSLATWSTPGHIAAQNGIKAKTMQLKSRQPYTCGGTLSASPYLQM